MKSNKKGKIYLLTIVLVVVLFLVYRFFMTDRFFNVQPQSTTINLEDSKSAFLIEKHPEQGTVASLELVIRGNLSDNITLYLSEDGLQSSTAIRIKNGKVNTSYVTKWKLDQAYLLFENPDESNSQLEIEYQFVSE